MGGGRRGRPTAGGRALQRYVAKAGLTKSLAQAQVIPDWPVLVGPQIAAVTKPESVAPDGTLFVRVSTSGWMTELQLMAPQGMAAGKAAPGAGASQPIRWAVPHQSTLEKAEPSGAKDKGDNGLQAQPRQ